MARIISLNITTNNDYEYETINSTVSHTGNPNELVQTDANGLISDSLLHGVVLRSRNGVKSKSLSSPPANPVEGDRYLVAQQGASVTNYDQIILSGLNRPVHNGTFDLAVYGGQKVTGIVEIEGPMVYFDTETEGQRTMTLSGLGIPAIDGKTLTVVKEAGYLTFSNNRYTWHKGSTGSANEFHWAYWSIADKVFVAWDRTFQEWKAFDLNQAVGTGLSTFLTELNEGEICDDSYFDISTSHVASVVSTSDEYPNEINKIPDEASSHVTYSLPRDHTYYIYQDSTKTKFIAYSEKSEYWTVFVLNQAVDLSSVSLSDNQGFIQDINNWDLLGQNSLGYGDGVSIPDSAHPNLAYAGSGGGSAGDWSAFSVNDIVQYTNGAWVKETPSVVAGTYLFVQDENTGYIYTGAAFHAIGSVQASQARQQVTVGSTPVSKGDLLYYTGANVVGKHPNTSNAQPIGFAASSAAAHSQVELQTEGIITGVLTNVPVNEKIFWTTNGLSSNPDSAAGTRVRVVGVSANGSDLQLIPLQQAIIN